MPVTHVHTERGLAIGPGGDQPDPASLPEDQREEPRGQLAALVLQRNRRHGQPGVLGQQGDDAVHVRRLEGPGQLGNESLLGR